MSIASALTGVAVLATLVTGTGAANAAPETQIDWNTHVEGGTVVTQVSSGGFRRTGDSIELTNAAGAVVLRVPLLFKVADRSIPFTANITGNTLRLTADQGQSAALDLAPVSPVPAAQPVAARATAIAESDSAPAERDIAGAISLGTVIGAAVGGAIGFAAGCALGALGTGAAVGAPTAGILAIPGAIIGCITVGITFIQAGTIAGSAVGAGVGAVVGAVLPA
ncbi:hypothetical protein [Nocardia salmonicida]